MAVLFVAGVPGSAGAQSSVVLSNLGQAGLEQSGQSSSGLVGQAFTTGPGASYSVTGLRVGLYGVSPPLPFIPGAPATLGRVALYSNGSDGTDDVPGTELAGVDVSLAAQTDTSDYSALVSATFSDTVVLVPGTKYWVVYGLTDAMTGWWAPTFVESGTDSGTESGWSLTGAAILNDGSSWANDPTNSATSVYGRFELTGAAAAPASTDASLSALRIRPAPAEDLSTGRTSFETTVDTEHYYVRVDATPSDPGAVVAIRPGDFREYDGGHQVEVGLGRTRVTVTVTAADGITTRTYTVFVKQGTVPAFGRKVVEDFDTLVAAGNTAPGGFWSDGTTMWVADALADKMYAYRMSDKTRDPARDFDTLNGAGNNTPAGIWSDGTTMWVSDAADAKIYAYKMSDQSRDSDKDFETLVAAGNNRPSGIWSDGTTMWVADDADGELYAYKMSDKARDSAKDFDTLVAAGNNRPSGIWSDGTTMWVSDAADAKIYAYKMSDRTPVAARDFDTLAAAGNGLPWSIWSDGSTMWVLDLADDRLFAYDMPVYGIGAVVRGSNMTIFFNRDLREGALLDNRQFIASKNPWWRAERIWVPLPQGSPPVIRGNTATLTMSDTPVTDKPRPTAGTDHSYRVQYVAQRDRTPRPVGFGEVVYDLLDSDDGVAVVDFEVPALRYTPYAEPSSPRVPATAGQPYTFKWQDFHFPFLHPVDSMSSVSIITLPGKGTLSAGGRAITEPDLPRVFSREELDAGGLVWTPPAGSLSSASHPHGSNRLWFTDFVFGAKVAPGDDIETYRMRIDLDPGVLVKNTGSTADDTAGTLAADEYAMAFRTGSNAGGYRVESVSVKLTTESGSTLPSLTLREGSPTGPRVARGPFCLNYAWNCGHYDKRLETPALEPAGTRDYRYWVRHPIGGTSEYGSSKITSYLLKPDTDYYVVATGASLVYPVVRSGTPDAGSQTDWTLPPAHYRANSDAVFAADANARLQFDVEGDAVGSGGMHSPHNAAATGLPRIAGAVFAAEPVTVDMSAVADSDGLRRVEFEYQWLVDGVAAVGETGSSFVPAAADVGKSLTVRVSFVDDAGYAESLISEAAGPVAAGGLRAKAAAVDGAALVLTYNEILDETRGGIPPASAFAVTAGGDPVAVTAVSVRGTTVTLTLGSAVTHGAAVRVGYTPAELGFVRDTLGRIAPSFSGLSAANGTAGVPGPPTGLAAAAFSATRIDLSWSAPADDGGAAVTGYRIEVSADGETWTVLAADTADTAYSHSGLAANSARRYRVSAVNSVGAGPASDAAAGTTDILVRNHGQSNDSIVYAPLVLAQRFRTGPHAGGWDLTGIDVASPLIGGAYVGAAVWTVDDDGNPDEEHAALALTDSAAAGVISYTAPAGTALAADTAYAVVLSVLYGASGYYDLTDSDSEDPGALTGWTIGDDYQQKTASSDDWHDNTTGRALRFAIRGAARPDTQTDTQPNNPATGAPTISGAAQVGETLTASTTGIADADGLTRVSYAYQWVRSDGADDADISGATASAYTLAADDQGNTITVRVAFTDDAGNAESLTSAATTEVDFATSQQQASANNPATGAPAISGSAQVGETLTASTGAIADTDGLTGASYAYQWIRSDGADDADISGATASAYTIAPADAGNTIKVRAAFTDDNGNAESLTSADTAAVTAASPALTAGAHDVPASHDGNAPFTFELRFSEEFPIGYSRLRDHAFTATGGEVTAARRLAQSQNVRWEITVEPHSNDDVTVVLPVTTDCAARGAICTADHRKQSNELTVTVTGPTVPAPPVNTPPTAVAQPLTALASQTPASHDGSASFTFQLRFSEDPSLSYKTLRDHAFTVTGAEIIAARRHRRNSNTGWTITVSPNHNTPVTITLPATSDCTTQNAICTSNNKKLTGTLEITIPGPSPQL